MAMEERREVAGRDLFRLVNEELGASANAAANIAAFNAANLPVRQPLPIPPLLSKPTANTSTPQQPRNFVFNAQSPEEANSQRVEATPNGRSATAQGNEIVMQEDEAPVRTVEDLPPAVIVSAMSEIRANTRKASSLDTSGGSGGGSRSSDQSKKRRQ